MYYKLKSINPVLTHKSEHQLKHKLNKDCKNIGQKKYCTTYWIK